MTHLLDARNLSVTYDRAPALRDVSIALDAGEIVALIGANGAGKTTTLRAITGLKKPTSGEVWFDGKRLDGLTPPQIVARGVVMVPEGRHVYPYMSVRDNLLMGAYLRRDSSAVRDDLDRIL
jgi:branched-chain amino acid transport system ATP-binding protein